MPVSTVDTAFVKQYESNLYVLSQQRGSKFQDKVRVETITNAEQAYWDTLGVVAAQKITGRHSDTPNNEQEHGRRRADPADYDTNSFIDKEDDLKMLIEPTSQYAMRQADALGRTKDDVVIEAALGQAREGKEGATQYYLYEESVGIDGDGDLAPVGTLPAVGTVATMTLAKILVMMQLFNEEDVDPDIPKYWVVSPRTIRGMLDLTEIGSADYNTVRALVNGKVDTFGGFNFFWSNRLTTDAATNTAYRSFAWAQDGIILGLAKEISSRIDQRTDKRYTTQVYSWMSMCAVRMEGAKVHECLNKIAL